MAANSITWDALTTLLPELFVYDCFHQQGNVFWGGVQTLCEAADAQGEVELSGLLSAFESRPMYGAFANPEIAGEEAGEEVDKDDSV